mmetsp:Transcript_18922/g.53761  ORF Transcript_18922/g.53761 Transcript_18922/m.53761 type:complete len:208 (-) Transcript_18922:1263-1886(-)
MSTRMNSAPTPTRDRTSPSTRKRSTRSCNAPRMSKSLPRRPPTRKQRCNSAETNSNGRRICGSDKPNRHRRPGSWPIEPCKRAKRWPSMPTRKEKPPTSASWHTKRPRATWHSKRSASAACKSNSRKRRRRQKRLTKLPHWRRNASGRRQKMRKSRRLTPRLWTCCKHNECDETRRKRSTRRRRPRRKRRTRYLPKPSVCSKRRRRF